MSGLTDAERESLRGLGQGQVPAVVEQIIAARVDKVFRLTLSLAAARLEMEADCSCEVCATYHAAARIVRALAPPT